MAKNSSRDPFILTRKRREYTQNGATPKISIEQGTYQKLQYAAVESGRSISEIGEWQSVTQWGVWNGQRNRKPPRCGNIGADAGEWVLDNYLYHAPQRKSTG